MAKATDDSALYTGGLYFVDTTRLKAALAGTGWSTNNLKHALIGDTNAISDNYAFQTWGRTVIKSIDGNGEPIVLGSDRLYVELYEYIRTREVTIHVNDSYTPADSHEFVRTYAGENFELDDSRAVDPTVDPTATPTPETPVAPAVEPTPASTTAGSKAKAQPVKRLAHKGTDVINLAGAAALLLAGGAMLFARSRKH